MRAFLLLVLTFCCSVLFADEIITGYESASPNPQTPGYHKLVYHYTDDGNPYQLSFLLYLPETYASPSTAPSTQATQPTTTAATRPSAPFPLLVFMSGLGERGSDPQMLFASGVSHDIKARPEVGKWLPMIMVGPQCPADARYEDDRIGRAITGLIDEISARYPVDHDRRYVTGFSMGGTGCWSVARFARDRLAVVAPIVARVFKPEVLADALAGTDATCLVISGETDTKSEPGSSEMVKALRARDVDVVHAMVPKGDHNLWPWYYRDKRFYEWLLSHRRGQPKPANRLAEGAMIEFARERSDHNVKFMNKMQAELQAVAKWWQIDNCSLWGPQGLRKEANGKQNVFLTMPYYYEVPCRLQTTAKVPNAPDARLHLVVGRHAEGDWRLIVRVNEQEILTTPIDTKTTPDLWRTIDVDLSKYAGQEVRLQVCQAAMNAFKNEQAYWEAVNILPEQ